MAENLDCFASRLLCTESTDPFFDDLDCNDTDDVFWGSLSWHHRNNQNRKSSRPLVGLPLQTEEMIKEMTEKERNHLPKDDYLKRLRSGDLDLRDRKEALDWICKAIAHYRFGPQSLCLSMNYFDRFQSVYELPRGKAWTMQLLAVTCLSLAAKLEETEVPQLVDLQVGEPKFIFEAKTIQRMEVLVLNTLKWRMQSLTPCSFIDYFLTKINDDQTPSAASISESLQLILSTIKGIDFLEFKPSEIAAAVAISLSGYMQPQDIDKPTMPLMHVEKGRVMKCVELIKDLSLMNGCSNVAAAAATNPSTTTSSSVPQSPDGVLDAACLSYKSEHITVGSCANSSHNTITSSDIKMMTKRGDTTHEN